MPKPGELTLDPKDYVPVDQAKFDEMKAACTKAATTQEKFAALVRFHGNGYDSKDIAVVCMGNGITAPHSEVTRTHPTHDPLRDVDKNVGSTIPEVEGRGILGKSPYHNRRVPKSV